MSCAIHICGVRLGRKGKGKFQQTFHSSKIVVNHVIWEVGTCLTFIYYVLCLQLQSLFSRGRLSAEDLVFPRSYEEKKASGLCFGCVSFILVENDRIKLINVRLASPKIRQLRTERGWIIGFLRSVRKITWINYWINIYMSLSEKIKFLIFYASLRLFFFFDCFYNWTSFEGLRPY